MKGEDLASSTGVIVVFRLGEVQVDEDAMSKPVIFTVSAIWDSGANVWSGSCDEIPAAADATTLDELLEKVSRMALDLAPDNHPGVDPGSIFIQVMAIREAVPVAA